MRETPVPGCIVLGLVGPVDSADLELQKKQRSIYVTRHYIDSYSQSKPLCRNVAREMFVPCIELDESPVSCIWNVFRSELTLFVLHITTIIFGVVKEALNLRHVGGMEHVHLAHTVIETIVTLLIVVLRMINTRSGYIEVQRTVQRLQHFDPVHEPHLRAVWTWMWLLLAVGVVNVVACVVCFVVFRQLMHLGWTILSNQGCIITTRVLAGFYEYRIIKAIAQIIDDQHKLVIHEALMLMKEMSAAEADSSRSDVVRRFVRAACSSNALDKPPYIVLSRDDTEPQHASSVI